MLGISTPVPVNEIHIILGLRTEPVGNWCGSLSTGICSVFVNSYKK